MLLSIVPKFIKGGFTTAWIHSADCMIMVPVITFLLTIFSVSVMPVSCWLRTYIELHDWPSGGLPVLCLKKLLLHAR